MLKSLHAKTNTDSSVIKKLMELTWKRRQHEIRNSPTNVLLLLEKYPYLGESDYLNFIAFITTTYTYMLVFFLKVIHEF